MAEASECVKVAVRCRPMNRKELDKGSTCVVECNEQNKTVTLKQAGDDMGRKFTYDYVYGTQSTQRQVYDEAAFSLIESVVEGYNGKYISEALTCLWADMVV